MTEPARPAPPPAPAPAPTAMPSPAAVPSADTQIAGLIFAVLVVDPAGVVRQANPAAEELLGRSAHRLAGQPVGGVLRFDSERVGETLARGEMRLLARGIGLTTASGVQVVNLTCSPLPSHAGWRVLTLSDAGQMENEEPTSPSALRAPAVLAHEIKNPLSAIRGASQLLLRRVGERERSLATMIAAEVDRIAALIDRMQQLGSREALVVGPCNLHEAIRNAMATVRAARAHACVIEEEFDPSLPPVAADAGALEQVLINLLANGCDAAQGQPVRVRTRFVSGLTLSAIRFGKATRLPIEIAVIDRGPGIDPALRDHVFEPFVSSKSHGQGLGLALVRKLVRDMGGRIAHERDQRAGTTVFRVNLPLAAQN